MNFFELVTEVQILNFIVILIMTLSYGWFISYKNIYDARRSTLWRGYMNHQGHYKKVYPARHAKFLDQFNQLF